MAAEPDPKSPDDVGEPRASTDDARADARDPPADAAGARGDATPSATDDGPPDDTHSPVPAPVEAETATQIDGREIASSRDLDPATSGSVDVALSATDLVPASSGSVGSAAADLSPASSGSVDVALSDPAAPVASASDLDSAPVSSGRVTAMTVAATGPMEESGGRGKRITEVGKDMLERGVATLGSGLETIGEGVSKLGDASKKVPIVGTGVARLGEGISSVGESIHDLPAVARTRRGRLMLRSLLVAFMLVFTWIAAIVALQMRRTDAPDFRPHAERILSQLGKGRAAIEEIYDTASPRFQEMVRKERFVDEMLDLQVTAGKFIEILSINESIVTRGPTGRIGRLSMMVRYAKGDTRAAVSLHWDDNEWKFLGVGVEVPPDVRITHAEREKRVAACADAMDIKRCDVHIAANQILEQLRDGQAAMVWDKASDIFQKQETRARFIQIQTENQSVLGEYRRIIAVTEAKTIAGTRAYFDVLVEYSRTSTRAVFGFIRSSKTEPWLLRSMKVTLPMPRIDDLGPPPQPSVPDGTNAPPPGKPARAPKPVTRP